MKKIYIAASLLIFITGCELGNNSNNSYSYTADVVNPYTKKISSGVLEPSDLTLLKDFDSGEFDTIKYLDSTKLKTECIVNNVRDLPIECADSTASTGKANCIVYSSALENAAHSNTNDIASVDDYTYSTKSAKELANSSGYNGNDVIKTSLSFYFDSDDKDRIMTKVVEEAIKSTNGSCSVFMDKDMTNYGMSFTTKEINGRKKVFATIMLGN